VEGAGEEERIVTKRRKETIGERFMVCLQTFFSFSIAEALGFVSAQP